jgi:hypothetical protein
MGNEVENLYLLKQSHNGIFVKDIVLMKIDTNELKQ